MSELNDNLRASLSGVSPGGRLTLTSGTPVTTSDVTGATSVYFTPFQHDFVWLWTGTTWYPVQFSETTLALGTLTSAKPYDIFGYLSGTSLAVESLVWTNDTTRATAITIQDGRYCKSGDKTRLYLGTFYTSSTTTTEDSKAKRTLFNMYNRVPREMSVIDTTDTWTYSTTSFRQANNTSANRLEYIDGIGYVAIKVYVRALASANVDSTKFAAGVGIDSTTVNSAQLIGCDTKTGRQIPQTAYYAGIPGVGRHTVVWLEYGASGSTTTWVGDNGTPTVSQSGMDGVLNEM